MKKTIFGILFAMLVISTIALAQNNEDKVRYIVKSQNGLLKATLGVQHNFKNGFTTELTKGQVKALERLSSKLGVEIEEIPQYQLLGKPGLCGNGELDKGEQCDIGIPCSTGTCNSKCKCVVDEEPPSEGRSCFPDDQIPYGISMVNGGEGGVGINVAVLDTGVAEHLDLNVKLCKDATKRGITNGCSDHNGHGTHVAGTVAANGGADGKGIFGVAPDSNLMVVKVCKGGGCWTDDMAAGIEYVADQGANIISMSIGGNTESSLVKDAIDYATSKGALVIAAAGNDGPAIGTIDYPAANPKVIAAGAIDSGKNVPDFSSRGINNNDSMITEREVEFGAPGVSVLSTSKNGCYEYMDGTSMATPHVAGLAAKLWQNNAAATRTYLQSIAIDILPLGEDPATGLGLPIAP